MSAMCHFIHLRIPRQRAESRRCSRPNDSTAVLLPVVGDPDGRGPVENLVPGKIVRDFLRVPLRVLGASIRGGGRKPRSFYPGAKVEADPEKRRRARAGGPWAHPRWPPDDFETHRKCIAGSATHVGLVAAAEKPDVLWERPDLERFYARLEDEYELKERADLLTRKLTVISDTGQALAHIIDTERSLRLERIIIALILLEVIFTV